MVIAAAIVSYEHDDPKKLNLRRSFNVLRRSFNVLRRRFIILRRRFNFASVLS